jgi:hypothetical protein
LARGLLGDGKPFLLQELQVDSALHRKAPRFHDQALILRIRLQGLDEFLDPPPRNLQISGKIGNFRHVVVFDAMVKRRRAANPGPIELTGDLAGVLLEMLLDL